jgi:transcriptional regulator of acetoin/glycerol metabolism
VRELKHVIQRASVCRSAGRLTLSDFEFVTKKMSNKMMVTDDSLRLKLDEVEKDAIVEALALYKGNKTKAATHLNMDRSILYKKLKKHHLL